MKEELKDWWEQTMRYYSTIIVMLSGIFAGPVALKLLVGFGLVAGDDLDKTVNIISLTIGACFVCWLSVTLNFRKSKILKIAGFVASFSAGALSCPVIMMVMAVSFRFDYRELMTLLPLIGLSAAAIAIIFKRFCEIFPDGTEPSNC